MDSKKENHYVLGFPRRNGGAFEHSWGLAQNLSKRGYDVKYYANWWNLVPSNLNLKTEELTPLYESELNDLKGVLHLQTHTWEYNGLLENIINNGNLKTIYGLHAMIPYYYYMDAKDKISLLKGEFSQDYLNKAIEALSEREKAQLSAIERADYLFTISKNHKKVLELFGVEKPIHIFENVSDFYDLSKEVINEAREESKRFRGFTEKENILLYCGKIYPRKGSKRLFESFKKIREEYPSSDLILLGTGEEKKEEMIRLGLDEGLVDSVTFVPWIDKTEESSVRDMLKYFLASDVLIQPMITPELYSKAVIDAMSVGVPTISCESPYTIGSSEDEEAIFNSFVEFKENPKKVQEIVIRAKEKIALENTWNSYISRLEKIVHKDKIKVPRPRFELGSRP